MLRPTRTTPASAIQRRDNDERNVLDRIKGFEGFDPEEGHSFLFYGESGSGKTTLWASFPGPILAIICSGGLLPGELKSISKRDQAKLDDVTLRSPSELDQIVTAIRTGQLTSKKMPGKSFRTVILDHASGFQNLKLQAYKTLPDVPVVKRFGDATKKDWGEIAAQVMEHLARFLSIRCNRVIIAQERIFLPGKDEDSMKSEAVRISMEDAGVLRPKVGAALMPSVTGWLNPACDYVVQTFVRQRKVLDVTEDTVKGKIIRNEEWKDADGVQFCARLGKHEVFMTKFRAPGVKLPEAIVLGDTIFGVVKSPTGYEQLMKYIKEAEENDR